MPTPKQKAYRAALDEVTRGYLRRERETINATVAILRNLRDRIAGELSAGDDFAMQQLRRNLDNLIAEMNGQLTATVRNGTLGAYQNGQQSVVNPLISIGYNLNIRPSQAQAVTLANFSADLIQGISQQALSKVNTQLRLAGLGGITNVEAMREISMILGFKGRGRTGGGIAYEAERIARTELQRAFNIAADVQGKESQELIPDLQKRWMHSGARNGRPSHLSVHIETAENPIPYDQDFTVGGEKMSYPLDPKASAKNTINCRCRVVAIVPEIGVLPSALDDKVRAQLDAKQGLSRKPSTLSFDDYLDGKKYIEDNRPLGPFPLGNRADDGRDDLTKESRAVNRYTGPGNYLHLNRQLRSGVLEPEYIEWSDDISKGLAKLPAYNGEVFRGMNFNSQRERDDFVDMFVNAGENPIFSRQFTSTSVLSTPAKDFAGYTERGVLMHIQSKTGRILGRYSRVPGEAEILFDKNTGFVIKRTDIDYDGLLHLYLEEFDG